MVWLQLNGEVKSYLYGSLLHHVKCELCEALWCKCRRRLFSSQASVCELLDMLAMRLWKSWSKACLSVLPAKLKLPGSIGQDFSWRVIQSFCSCGNSAWTKRWFISGASQFYGLELHWEIPPWQRRLVGRSEEGGFPDGDDPFLKHEWTNELGELEIAEKGLSSGEPQNQHCQLQRTVVPEVKPIS